MGNTTLVDRVQSEDNWKLLAMVLVISKFIMSSSHHVVVSFAKGANDYARELQW
jgi:hypothetical protein